MQRSETDLREGGHRYEDKGKGARLEAPKVPR